MTGKKKTAAWAVLVAGSLAMFLYSFTLPNLMLKIITMLSLIVSLSALVIELHEKSGGEGTKGHCHVLYRQSRIGIGKVEILQKKCYNIFA